MNQPCRKTTCRRPDGFTLIELIIVLVLLGILGTMGADFIALAFKGFSNTNARTAIYEEGSLALLRLERDLHNAVPNAVMPTAAAGAAELRFGMIDEAAMGAGADRVFGLYTQPASEFPTWTLTDAEPTATPAANRVISVYNRNWTDFAGGSRLFKTTAPAGPGPIMTFSEPITDPSPRQRYYMTDRVVRFRWDSGSKVLFRSRDQVTESGAGDFSTATEIPLATDVSSLVFYYAPGTLTRNGVVSVNFAISRNNETVNFHKEINIRNAP
ncbi:MAG: hypothetical protein A2521_05455 [Deltaproteobacteria bacterium RIFOXYD12_FULL_57_12]|nr:MAG: hypothetical protein A2521_05455 [Deltaproteobacteria bacterium RIFOXYD12_FULL_57_12]